jgi:PadR family transcriptional regulator, regulatory protein PadR
LTEYSDHRYVRSVRLAEPTFFILSALTEQPLHGYGVMLAVRDLSGGRLSLRPGTLYTALDRLADDGLLTVDRTEEDRGRLRRYYRLTDQGAATLAAEVEQVRANAAMAADRLRRRAAAAATAAATKGAAPGRPAFGGAR